MLLQYIGVSVSVSWDNQWQWMLEHRNHYIYSNHGNFTTKPCIL